MNGGVNHIPESPYGNNNQQGARRMKVTIKQPVQMTVETESAINTFDTVVTKEYEIPLNVTLPLCYTGEQVLHLNRYDKENDFAIKQLYKRLLAQRNEILAAFIAKYGYEPDEIEQVERMTENGWIWYVTKRGE